MSYFQKVVDFNTQFGVNVHDTPQLNIFNNDPNTVDFCMKLIREENKELEQAVIDNNFVEVADAIADSIYVLLGMSARLGINMDNVFNLVHDNNMAKLCLTEQEAQKSVQYYLDNPNLGYESPNYRKAPNNI
ncbi:MAG: nucleoside triphosphate pyrophosphohydrolase family protein, partial [Nitrosopumilus sp.]|nr:nucleoside triphosphate pyrophosphohydrolase family protein [Nitrosopumilus sp.]